MKKHILLENAHVYPLPRKHPQMKGYSYSDEKGYWTSKASLEAYVYNKDEEKPRTKKCDVETGEDQKGE